MSVAGDGGGGGAWRLPGRWVIVGLVVLVLVLGVVRLSVGALGLPGVGEAGWWDRVWLLLDLRGVPLAVALVAGAGLGGSGVVLQSMLRNPLASPWVLGLSAGAGLGVTLEIYARGRGMGGLGEGVGVGTPVAALLGAFGALGVVFVLARRRGLLDPVSLLLVGVMVSIVCGAGVMFVQQLMPDRGFVAAGRWMMGSVSADTPWVHVWVAAGAVAVCLVVSWRVSVGIDALSVSDDEARSLGVGVGRLRLLLFVVSGVMTASAVVLAGPIGFVGLVCPHAARLLVGPGNRVLLPAAALAGGAALVGAELVSSVAWTGAGRVPVGVITALVGGPLFIALLRARRGGLEGGAV